MKMKRHLATPGSIEAHNAIKREIASRESVTLPKTALTRERVVDAIKGLNRTGYKIPAKIRPKVSRPL